MVLRNKTSEAPTEEELQARAERSREGIALLQSWLDDDEEPTEEDERLWQEMIRDLDSFRPERPLFEKFYR